MVKKQSPINLDQSAAVIRTINYMRSHCDESISLYELSKIACISRFHFIRVFKKYTGITPSKFHSLVRFSEAMNQIITTKKNISTICHDVGFESVGTFTNEFTKLTGISPEKIRNRKNNPIKPQIESSYVVDSIYIHVDIACATKLTGINIYTGLFKTEIPSGIPEFCSVSECNSVISINVTKCGLYFMYSCAFIPDSGIFVGINDSPIRIENLTTDIFLGTISLRPYNSEDLPILVVDPFLKK